MPLDRNIYWIGRQWAVTGFGVQAVDQRLQGAFDIEAASLWDDGVRARVRGQGWVNAEDFEKALKMARQRYPAPEGMSLPLVDSVLELISQPAITPSPQRPPAHAAAVQLTEVVVDGKAVVAAPASSPLHLHVQGQLARFLPQWRVKR